MVGEFLATIASLLCLLLVGLARGELTKPEDWLYVQLNGRTHENYELLIRPIRQAILQVDDIIECLDDLVGIFNAKHNTRVVLAIDEAGYLVSGDSDFSSGFSRPSNDKELMSPVLTPILHTLQSNLPRMAVLLAGTSLDLSDKDVKFAAAAKSPSETGAAITFTIPYYLHAPMPSD